MSLQLISLNPDLQRLRDEGYDVEIRSNHLLVKDVPYVNSRKEIKRGILVSTLNLAGDVTLRPDTHVAYLIGEYPCNSDGSEIDQIRNSSNIQKLGENLEIEHTFSAKPVPLGYYEDYYAKMVNYVNILSGPAKAIDQSVTAKTFPVVEPEDEESVFNYIDTASTRAGIGAVTKKLELEKVAIIGLGGTGSYILDLIAKCPIKEIHIFDGDYYLQHNAFRSPGAPSVDDLRARSLKVVYLKNLYSKMHRGIVAHEKYIDEDNVEQLRYMNFIFICLDRGSTKKMLIGKLEEYGTPFIDVGMGIYIENESLGGIIRTTTSTPEKREHLNKYISFSDEDGNNEYARNIQIADLNALNAVLAVVKWKKLFGFYHDFEKEHDCTYTIDGNVLNNEETCETRNQAQA